MTLDLNVRFKEVFGNKADYQFFAPGRINLIGEHTDYNGGYVFPCAITLGTYALIRLRQDNVIRAYSENFSSDSIKTISLDNLNHQESENWTNYIKGVVYYLQEQGYRLPHGFDVLFYGNIPNGAGLSSSASFELLVGTAIKHIFNFHIDMLELVKLGKRVENEFIGVNSGIMDQFAVGMSQENHAIMLDCNTLQYELVPVDLGEYTIVIMNTNKRRELADSKYNERFSETRQALAEIQEHLPIQTLADLTMEQFEKVKHVLSTDTLVKRARHAVSENQRVIEAVAYLKENNLVAFGELMKQSHLSTELDYEVTGKELDTLVHTAWEQDGVLGARMTGAGFGGCAIALVHCDNVEDFKTKVGKIYTDTIGYAPDFYIAQTSNGAGFLE
ncbi:MULTISPECIES: galactokinase [unclassified Granulicatella]|uniref:galactokinase n=1 Tax=unclassified Granulicatella TaxID=2630493 RepID=UPI00107326B1|nr:MULTISPECIES: galactokinase [unclassified Granulicatella]MBF0780587.1 galactokinase [Granulicatella sp. 19428wC4_WM01]TFU94896.1 galactokinase [Granulicatella sp. WM01]